MRSAELIRSLPGTWGEAIALPAGEIGEVAAVGVGRTAIAGEAPLTIELRPSGGFIARLAPHGECRSLHREPR